MNAMMTEHNVAQGSEEWHALRANHFTASEAPAMMNASKYVKRNELLHQKATKEVKPVSPGQQKLFDKGHAAEEAIRPVLGEMAGDDFYPIVGTIEIDGLPLLASFDGLTLDYDLAFEHKLYNQGLVAGLRAGDSLEPHYYWQLEQQMLLAGLGEITFAVSDGTKESLVTRLYKSVPERREALIAGWKQFALDLGEYKAPEQAEKVEADAIETLPALVIEITGGVSNTNIEPFKAKALAYVESINTNLITDDDFANADANAKFCEKAEKQLAQVKQQSLEQTADINKLFETVDEISEQLRQKRLTLSKLVKTAKEERKAEIVRDAVLKVVEHATGLEAELQGYKIPPSNYQSVLAEAGKGKRTLDSYQNSVDSKVAEIKIEHDQVAQLMRANLAALNNYPDEQHLFNDFGQHILKPTEDVELVLRTRVDDEKKRIAEAEERAKREAEEKAAREAEAAKQAEQPAQSQTTAQATLDNIKEELAQPSDEPKQPLEINDATIGEFVKVHLNLTDFGYLVVSNDPQHNAEALAKIKAAFFAFINNGQGE